MSTKLKLEQIYKLYGKKVVLNGLELEVEEGEFLVVLGPSGMGKSTLLRVIVGIEDLSYGKIILDGKDISGLPPNKRDIAMVFQNYALYPTMSVYNNIAFPLKMAHLKSAEIKRKVEEIAATLNISEILNSSVNQISGGQKQRVALARSLVRNPKMFLLDEPLSNLDARVRYTARTELKKLQKELGFTFVYVTHDQTEASTLADRVAVLRNGKLEQIDRYEKILNEPKSRWLGDFMGDVPMNFVPGTILGSTNTEIGFRDSWVEEGNGPYVATVDYTQVIDDVYRAFCHLDISKSDMPNVADKQDEESSKSIILRVKDRYQPGDQIKFSLSKYNVYSDGVLKEVVKKN
jgi:ABC-type sugar transport system ATPase subunit